MSGDFRVGPWLVKPSLNLVSSNGTTVRLETKVMEVLVCLAEHPEEAVSKETLLQTVWPDTFVSEDVLKRCVSELRRVFEDDAREPRIIETIPKRGYRLLAPVEPVNRSKVISAVSVPETANNLAAPSKNRWWAGAMAIAAVVLIAGLLIVLREKRSASAGTVPPIRSLAVLPLQNLSADPAQEYFSDGMTDALITELSHIASVRVISRTSSMQYKKTRKSLPEIARELNVDGIVEGTVQRSGDRVRINAQLILAPADKHLWANSYERDLRDVFALERDVTEDIAHHVQERLRNTNSVQFVQPQPVDAKVLDAYFLGNFHLGSFGKGAGDDEKKTAATYFQQAIDANPTFAPAYNGLANAHLGLFWPSTQDAQIATKAARQAAALDPNLSDAHRTLGDIEEASWNWSAAEDEYRRAIALNPNSADAHGGLSNLLLIVGRLDEAWREATIAQELEPSHDHVVNVLKRRGQHDRAIAVLQMMLKRYPDDGYLHLELFEEYLGMLMYKEASYELNRVAILFGFPGITEEGHRTRTTRDNRAAIRRSLQGWENLMTKHQAFVPVNLADGYAALGDKDRALYWLEHAYAHRDMGIAAAGLTLEWLNAEFLLDPLRSDPRFKDLVRRVGLP